MLVCMAGAGRAQGMALEVSEEAETERVDDKKR